MHVQLYGCNDVYVRTEDEYANGFAAYNRALQTHPLQGAVQSNQSFIPSFVHVCVCLADSVGGYVSALQTPALRPPVRPEFNIVQEDFPSLPAARQTKARIQTCSHPFTLTSLHAYKHHYVSLIIE